MIRALLLSLVLLPTAAMAQEAAPREGCPVALPVQDVSATMTTVTLDGRTFAVRGPGYRARFHRMLRRCGLDDAADRFATWRGMRRATNVTGVLGLVVNPVVWGGTAATATAAGVLRDELEREILRESRALAALPPAPPTSAPPTPAPPAPTPSQDRPLAIPAG